MKELEEQKTTNQIQDGVMLYGWNKKRFEEELNLRVKQLQSELKELIKDNVKSEDHLYRKLLSTQSERDELKKKLILSNKRWEASVKASSKKYNKLKALTKQSTL